ncbi:MAG: LysR family transcriptional regulator [Alphaproteobacteria bacterium]
MNWDDARLLLAVARAGQLLAAARRLGISQATLGRRISTLEAALGVQLLIRTTTGCELTENGRRLVASVEEIEQTFTNAQGAMTGAGAAVSGTVRIGTPDGFGVAILAPRLADFTQRHPGISIQLVPVARDFSLSRREADIAVMVHRPERGRLVARKLTDYTLGLYAARSYLRDHAPPRRAADLGDHTLIGYVDDLIYSPSLDYTGEAWRGWRSHHEVASAIGQFEAVRAGAGIGILHDYMAVQAADLVPVLSQVRIRRAYWTVLHESLRNVARIRTVADFLADTVRMRRDDFVLDEALPAAPADPA